MRADNGIPEEKVLSSISQMVTPQCPSLLFILPEPYFGMSVLVVLLAIDQGDTTAFKRGVHLKLVQRCRVCTNDHPSLGGDVHPFHTIGHQAKWACIRTA
jgi:hypothetical protein